MNSNYIIPRGFYCWILFREEGHQDTKGLKARSFFRATPALALYVCHSKKLKQQNIPHKGRKKRLCVLVLSTAIIG